MPEVQLHLAEESLPIWRKTEEELGEMNVPPPYWAFAWAGGQALARFVLDEPETVARKSILDVGTGSGLVAIAAMLAGAGHAYANDIDTYAIEACRVNASANAVALSLSSDDLLLSDADAVLPDLPDVVFLADVFYEKALAAGVMSFASNMKDRGCIILVGDPSRSYFPSERFSRMAHYAVPVTRELEDTEIKNAAVWKFLG